MADRLQRALFLSGMAAQGKMVGMRSVAAGCAILLLLAVSTLAQSAKVPVKTGKIYVGNFGMGDDAEQLKLALGYEMARAGFKVVDYEQQADTTLSGLIVTRVEGSRPVKRVTVFLTDKTGKKIWDQDIGSTSNSTQSDTEGLRQRAQDIAKALKKDSAPPPKKKPASSTH